MAKILILDDSEVLLAVARASLEAVGHVVVTRDSPIGFSAMLRAERPDVALIDVLMPALAGSRLVELLRPRQSNHQGDTLLVLHSGMVESELQQLAADCGADGYILKSHQPRQLPARVAELLRVQRSSRRAKAEDA